MIQHRRPWRRGLACVVAVFAWCGLCGLSWGADPIKIDFEDENIDIWEIVDEPPENLGDQGPSNWEIVDSGLGFDGKVLTQNSNIWGEPEDHMLMGTIIYYNQQQFKDFKLDVDVIASDNDGMGFVWGYQDLDKHYRFQLMNDRWPELEPIDGFHGPYLIAHKRISNESPWYEVMEVLETDDYFPYEQGFENHWTLEVKDGNWTITIIDSFGEVIDTLSGSDDTYQTGYVGIQLYAQNGVEFDNFVITPMDEPTLPGDFNRNNQLDAGDIDLLSAEVRAMTNKPEFDLNNDQKVDDADRRIWVTDPTVARTWFGDANLDKEFNSSDFVQVFQVGKYETGQDAGWAQGDWNGDNRFDSGDFVTAFQDGGFERGPRAAAAAVPEPTGTVIASTILLLVGVVQRKVRTTRRA